MQILGQNSWIYQKEGWATFHWDHDLVTPALAQARFEQGHLYAQLLGMGMEIGEAADLQMLEQDCLNTSSIEGINFPPASVRSSLAWHLGANLPKAPADAIQIEGLVLMTIDATRNRSQMSAERLCNWHQWLFPMGRVGTYQISIGSWRQPGKGPMQIVFGALGKQKVHYQAPDAEMVPSEMERLLDWINIPKPHLDPVLEAGIAHFWFETIHPFDDGNGRIGRALMDYILAKDEKSRLRYYSMSRAINSRKQSYYEILERTQQGTLDITKWLVWFLETFNHAILDARQIAKKVIIKAAFWQRHGHHSLNPRQRLMLDKLLSDFEGALSTSKWAKMCKCSSDTALRDIQQLQALGILQMVGGGRSVRYEVVGLAD
jgi:Fic family protein